MTAATTTSSLHAHTAVLNALLAKGESARLRRAASRPVSDVSWDDNSWTATCAGTKGASYSPRIRVYPTRSFGCSCPDHKGRARRVGPCKHVLSLALVAKDELGTLVGMASWERTRWRTR